MSDSITVFAICNVQDFTEFFSYYMKLLLHRYINCEHASNKDLDPDLYVYPQCSEIPVDLSKPWASPAVLSCCFLILLDIWDGLSLEFENTNLHSADYICHHVKTGKDYLHGLDQGSPTPRLQTNTSPWPIRTGLHNRR